jgi:uncharacterized protein YyaL (SSP411 family)
MTRTVRTLTITILLAACGGGGGGGGGAGADPERYAAFFGVAAAGNFVAEHGGEADLAGANILHEPVVREQFVRAHDLDPSVFAQELQAVTKALYERRAQRVPPGLDDKILTSWNALAIRGLARAGAWLDEPRYVDAARRAAAFVRDQAVVDGRLMHTVHDGRARVPAFLEDVAGLAAALLDLAAATADPSWVAWAIELADDAVTRFADPDGGFFQTADDAETLVMRPKDTWDNATPAGSSLLASAAWQLSLLTGDTAWRDVAIGIVRALQDDVPRTPSGFGELLQVVGALAADGREVAVVGRPGEARDRLLRVVWSRPRPGSVVAVTDPDDPARDAVALLSQRDDVGGAPAAYVCRGFVCDAPTTDAAQLARLLETDA